MDLATIQLKLVGLDVAREQLANTVVLVPTPTITLPGGDDVTYVIAQRSISEGTLVRPGSELFRTVINQILKLRLRSRTVQCRCQARATGECLCCVVK